MPQEHLTPSEPESLDSEIASALELARSLPTSSIAALLSAVLPGTLNGDAGPQTRILLSLLGTVLAEREVIP